MDKEFKDFFLYCHKITNSNQTEMKKILRPLKTYLWKQQLKKLAMLTFIFATICCSIYYVDRLNWYFCALGRTVMIQILPIWNWTYLANAKCLIAKATGPTKSNEVLRSLDAKDCRACEHFGKIVFKSSAFHYLTNLFS